MTLKVSDIGEKELVKYIIANSKKITPDDTQSRSSIYARCRNRMLRTNRLGRRYEDRRR